ncbi:MAG: alpha-glucosidase/alpha-galactosidase [Chloroflexi bacterium]|nr:alpha-glucosidase/alpha-galactosidase [Chloroflexota bacterium]MCL5274352.1 alpha-glucosidase/alpha-galactosidase [Chloroflexota bacterium]
MTKIVMIGVGSTSFGPSIFGDLFSHAEQLRGSQVWLVDINQQSLDLMARYAGRLNESVQHAFELHSTTDRRAALTGADFVIVSVAVDRLDTWRLDWQIPLKHGVRHVLGENGGPGGLSHALRNIPLLLAIARDVEELAPQALVLNFTNPMSRLCLALHQHTQVRFVGLCHQIGAGYRLVNRVLKLVERRADDDDAGYRRRLEERIHLTAAGLNHFTFILDMRDRATGADLYPLFREKVKDMPADFELMSRRLLDTYGLFCATGDGHAGEYVGFASETIPLTGYDFDGRAKESAELRAHVVDVAEGRAPVKLSLSGERAIQIIDAVTHDLIQPELAVNIPNNGCISNLPADAVVEAPAVVSARGVQGVHVGELPQGLAAMLRQQIDIQMLVVEAGVHGDRNAALQALLLDPTVHSYAQAKYMLDELLRVHERYLPQFAA